MAGVQTVVQVPADIAGADPGPLTTASTTSESGSATTVPTPAAVAQQGAAYEADKGIPAAQGAVGAAQVDVEAGRAEAARMAQAEAAREAEETQRAQEAWNARLAAATKAADEAEESHAKFQYHDPWKTASTGTRIIRGIASFLGGIGLQGGQPNRALEQINKEVDQDFASQRAELEQREQVAKFRRGRVQDTQSQYERDMATLAMKQAKAHELVAQKAIEMAAMRGIPLAQAQNSVLVQQQAAEAERRKLEALQRYDKHLTSNTSRATSITEKGSNAKALADAKAEGEATAVRDEKGNVIGHVPSGRGGAQAFATRDADYARAEKQLEALHKDILENGERVLLPEAVKRREVLKHNADIAVATVSPLGKTDEAMKAEQASIGDSGAYTLTGANPEAVANKLSELREQRQRYRNETLIPVRSGAPPTPGAAAAPETPRLSKGEAVTLMHFVHTTPASDPRRKQALDVLKANNYAR
jgi:hypothetical protein